MVLATPLGTLYPGAQLDSGLRHVDVVTAAGLDILACALALGNRCLHTGSSCSGGAGPDGMDWAVTGRWQWVSVLQLGLGLTGPCLGLGTACGGGSGCPALADSSIAQTLCIAWRWLAQP